ncbi:RNA-directed RNA polymerase L [Gossypium arboreum]|uniref:RNA-directed RNA polymerase L n=1 Tax=Gossypium arboreum TaxID=29729 RepID=A0A0B0MXB1_GOSAR|nr:RNA-directed RNA polymerase L [Gossypium arboreum]
MAPMTDLSIPVFRHFLMTVFESLTISILFNLIKIPSLTACKPAYASAMDGVAISECMTACDARISPSAFCTSKPVADLDDCRSNAALKWIVTLPLLHTCWVFPVELRSVSAVPD